MNLDNYDIVPAKSGYMGSGGIQERIFDGPIGYNNLYLMYTIT